MSNPLNSDPTPIAPSAAAPSMPNQPPPLDRGHSNVFGLEDGDDLGIGSAVKATIKEFRSLDYGYLLPFNKILSVSLLRKKAVRWVIGFGLFPLVLAVLKHNFEWSLEGCAWWLGGYFCVLWATYFFGILRPQDKVWRRGMKWAFFTVIVGVPLLLVAQKLPVIKTFYFGAGSESFLFQLIGFILGVGILEETCKALPFLLFALRRKESISSKEGIVLGMMSGFGFALAEVVQYSVGYWAMSAHVSALATARAIDNPAGYSGLLPRLVELNGDVLLSQIVRFITAPLLHACWAGIVGWFIAVASRRTGSRWPVVVTGILFVAALHGLYDVFSDGFVGVGFAGLSILVFMGYLIHAVDEEIASKST